MAEPLLTAFGVGFATGAGTKLGEYGAKKGIEFCENTVEAIEKECEAGWERDKEAGGLVDFHPVKMIMTPPLLPPKFNFM